MLGKNISHPITRTVNMKHHYDYVIIGSGFGGSVSALRLAEKGYSVLVIEKGKWFNKPKIFRKPIGIYTSGSGFPVLAGKDCFVSLFSDM